MNATEPQPISPLKLRLATLAFPPLGLIYLWRTPRGVARKILGTIGVTLYSLLYAAAMLAMLVKFHALEIEWFGGTGPRLVHRRTRPNFDALEANRRSQTNAPVFVVTNASAYWTGFRGPLRDGHYTEKNILTNWPQDGPRVLWRQPCGGGYASFAIAHGRAFTLEQRRDEEAVVAYDISTGRELWAFAYAGKFNDEYDMGGIGPRTTPVWDDGRVFALGSQGRLHCLDAATGGLLWKRDALVDSSTTVLQFGMAASPLVVDDKLIVSMGDVANDRSRGVFAYNKITGEPLWKSQTDKQSYTSPMLVTLAGQPQLLCVGAKRLFALAPGDGALLWEFPWSVQYDNCIAQPVPLGGDRV
ncbi:MAG: PQQ-like beta-propeller repeat protein, partial [Verrucomicrobia bacterium]|nr:PQQ-like beta-propeller repeat protein [Verrucomicrobiota bacterium]